MPKTLLDKLAFALAPHVEVIIIIFAVICLIAMITVLTLVRKIEQKESRLAVRADQNGKGKISNILYIKKGRCASGIR